MRPLSSQFMEAKQQRASTYSFLLSLLMDHQSDGKATALFGIEQVSASLLALHGEQVIAVEERGLFLRIGSHCKARMGSIVNTVQLCSFTFTNSQDFAKMRRPCNKSILPIQLAARWGGT